MSLPVYPGTYGEWLIAVLREPWLRQRYVPPPLPTPEPEPIVRTIQPEPEPIIRTIQPEPIVEKPVEQFREEYKAFFEETVHPPQYEPYPETSEEFYAAIGYPQYAGKYEPFQIPKGLVIQEIKEQPEGLEITLVTQPKKGIAQTIYETAFPKGGLLEMIGLGGITEPRRKLQEYGLIAEKTPPTKLIALTIAPFEATFYGIGSLIGGAKATIETGQPQLAKGWEWAGLETPIIPTTVSGGLISTAIESFQAGKPVTSQEMKAIMKWTPEEMLAGFTGELLLIWTTQKAAHVISVPAKKYFGKAIGYAEKTVMPETYYYYKYVLEKPMLTTMAKEYATGTIKALIGEEAFYYTAKIAIPKFVGQTFPMAVSKVRQYVFETPLGEAYLYGKAVAYPTLKYVTLPQIEASISKAGTYGKSVFMESPLGETYLYGKAVAYPTFKYAVTTKTGELASIIRGITIESPFGEAYLYTKGVAIPEYAAIVKGISQKLPSIPRLPSEVQAYFSEYKLFLKSAFGKEYILPISKTPSYPMKPLWLPQKVVEFPTKPISIIAVTKTGKTVTSTMTQMAKETVAVSKATSYLVAAAPTVMHAWKGVAYPGTKRRAEEIEETMFLGPAFAPLTRPQQIERLSSTILGTQQIKGITPTLLPKGLVTPISAQTLRQSQQQAQRQTQLLRQEQMLKQTQDLFKAYKLEMQIKPPSFKRMQKGLWGKWFKREHAIPTEREIMRQLGFGTVKRRSGARRKRLSL